MMEREKGERALYVGRFQIFHTGHLEVAKYISSQEGIGTLVVAIGSTQYSRHEKHPFAPWILNPFTFEERKGMVASSLDGVVDDYEIIGVPDAHDTEMWMRIMAYRTQPDVFYSNSPSEREEALRQGIDVCDFPAVDGCLHAQVIREMMLHDDAWERYVPETTERYMKDEGLVDVLKGFYRMHRDEIPAVHDMQRAKGIRPYGE